MSGWRNYKYKKHAAKFKKRAEYNKKINQQRRRLYNG